MFSKKNKRVRVLSSFICALAVFCVSLFFGSTKAYANVCDEMSYSLIPSFAEGTKDEIKLTITNITNLEKGDYKIAIFDERDWSRSAEASSGNVTKADGNTQMVFTISNSGSNTNAFEADTADWASDDHHVYLYTGGAINKCYIGKYNVTPAAPHCEEPIQVVQTRVVGGTNQSCYAHGEKGCFAKTESDIRITAQVLDTNGQPYTGDAFIDLGIETPFLEKVSVSNGSLNFTLPKDNLEEELITGRIYAKTRTPTIGLGGGTEEGVGPFGGQCSGFRVDLKESCDDTISESCLTEPATSGGTGAGLLDEYKFSLCKQITNQDLIINCVACEDKEGVWTALGCIEQKPASIVRTFVELGVGAGGGVCLLMTLMGGFMLTTSQGETKQVNEAKEMITSAIIGLLFIIFSVVILQFIGVTIFHIPGFGESTV